MFIIKPKNSLLPDEKLMRWMLAAFLATPLLPEYIAPLATLLPFCSMLKYYRGTGQKIVLKNQQVLMLIFLCWQFIGIFRSNNAGSSILFSFLWLFMFLGFVFVSNLLDSKEVLDRALFAITLSGGIAGSIGIGQIILFHYGPWIAEPLKTMFNPLWGRLDIFLAKIAVNYVLPANLADKLPRQVPYHIAERASSTFTNPIFFACYLVMVLPFAAYCFFYFKDKKKKFISLACIVAIIGGIAGSYSRAPYLAVVITVFVLLFMGWKKALSILAITPLFLLIFPSGVYKRLLSLLDLNDGSIVTRANIWAACTEMLREKWVWGMGPGVGNVRDMLINQYGIHQPHAHNLFMQLFLEGGIFGVSVFALIILWILFDMIVLCLRSKEGRPLAVAIIASLAGLLTCGITDYVLYGPKILQFFMMLLGLALAVKKIYPATSKKHKTGSTMPPS